MNIVIRLDSGRVIVRPDTTWERDNEDVYLPPFVDSLTYSPVLFARVSKPGRSIGRRFASRYYDGIGYGVLLYPENMIDGAEEGFACASCVDHTSFLPFPLYNPVTLGQGNLFRLEKNGTELYRTDGEDCSIIEEALEEVSRYCYLRIGDIVAIELSPRKPLADRRDGRVRITGTFCDNQTLDFSAIF